MHWIFSVITDRIRALFVADVALELESQALAREADRRAQLLRQAQSYREEGLDTVADDLEQQADELTVKQPLAGVLPALEHWQGRHGELPAKGASPTRARLSAPKKKSRKKASRKSR